MTNIQRVLIIFILPSPTQFVNIKNKLCKLMYMKNIANLLKLLMTL